MFVTLQTESKLQKGWEPSFYPIYLWGPEQIYMCANLGAGLCEIFCTLNSKNFPWLESAFFTVEANCASEQISKTNLEEQLRWFEQKFCTSGLELGAVRTLMPIFVIFQAFSQHGTVRYYSFDGAGAELNESCYFARVVVQHLSGGEGQRFHCSHFRPRISIPEFFAAAVQFGWWLQCCRGWALGTQSARRLDRKPKAKGSTLSHMILM